MQDRQALNSYGSRSFAPAELALIKEVIDSCGGLSRKELAHTVCELLGWKRPSGGLKALECAAYLERLESAGVLELPRKQRTRPVGSRTRIPVTERGEAGRELVGEVNDFAPIELELVETASQAELFRELVGRHHYLGFAVAYGAQLRYLAYASRPGRAVVACLQFSSPAWRMAVRDRWIGWDEGTRREQLQRVVNNSRFLILPWVRVKNLASLLLSRATRRLGEDWRRRYGIDPLLVETLVDRERYSGHCYRAANFIELGETTGRGRMDREHARHGARVKTVLAYPLVSDARARLRQGCR
ncbi:MAG: DUF4338 domain-containing protein [Thermoanaerobaculaceae bacterium]|nr:DUF4338 domain-containing protein [Thermoanaerobaculaceae bacterium]